MKDITGLIGRDDLIDKVVKEIRKGRHLVLTGPVGIGKTAVLEAALERLAHLRGGRTLVSIGFAAPPPAEVTEAEPTPPWLAGQERRQLTTIHITDHQAKGQFVAIARGLLESGIVKPSALDLAKYYDEMDPREIEWSRTKRQVTRLSIRDLTAAIVPAIHAHAGQILIAVDDMTDTTPTLVAFWLAIMEKAQLIGGASQKKKGLARLWWRMTEIEVPPLSAEDAKAITQVYVRKTGMLIEAPALYASHIVKQSGGNPRAIADMLADSSKERVVDKRKIREMKHAAGVRYLDFTPVVIVGTACIVGARYLAMGTGDTALYIGAGMMAAVVFSVRFLLFRGAGKAN